MDRNDLKEVDKGYTTLDNIEIPEMVYKYRSWGKDVNSDNVLLKNQLYLAPPSSFEDEFDCKIPIRYDLLDNAQIIKWGIPIVRSQHPLWNDEAILREVKYLAKRLPFNDKAKMQDYMDDEWESYNSKAGILSLCTNSLNSEMWERYADHHQGICYGYNTKELIQACGFRAAGPVIYEDKLPIIHPLDDVILKGAMRVYFKLSKWRFEEEYRIREFNDSLLNSNNRVRTYYDKTLRELTLGVEFKNDKRDRIIDILKQKGSSTILYQAKSNDGILTREVINY